MTYEMYDWLIEGNRWTLCKATVIRDFATVVTYDSRDANGRARRGAYGWLVTSLQNGKA